MHKLCDEQVCTNISAHTDTHILYIPRWNGRNRKQKQMASTLRLLLLLLLFELFPFYCCCLFIWNFDLIFFRTMHLDEHLQLLRDNIFVWDFMLCYTSWCKTFQTDFVEFVSSQQYLYVGCMENNKTHTENWNVKFIVWKQK